MDNLLFSAEKAEELNWKLQELDPRLFLFCNYNPMPLTGEPQADVFITVMNLYRATADSVPLWKKIQAEPFSDFFSSDGAASMGEVDKNQNHLRGYMAHNNHDSNGGNQVGHIAYFDTWQMRATNGWMLSSDEGCQNAVAWLMELGDRLEKALTEFIENALNASKEDQEKLINAFVQQILYWYSLNSQKIVILDYVDSFVEDKTGKEVGSKDHRMKRLNLFRNYLVTCGEDREMLCKVKPKEINALFLAQAQTDMEEIACTAEAPLLPQNLIDEFIHQKLRGVSLEYRP